MNKDISQFNDKGHRYGYWERYYNYDGGNITYKYFYFNDIRVGYEEIKSSSHLFLNFNL